MSSQAGIATPIAIQSDTSQHTRPVRTRALRIACSSRRSFELRDIPATSPSAVGNGRPPDKHPTHYLCRAPYPGKVCINSSNILRKRSTVFGYPLPKRLMTRS